MRYSDSDLLPKHSLPSVPSSSEYLGLEMVLLSSFGDVAGRSRLSSPRGISAPSSKPSFSTSLSSKRPHQAQADAPSLPALSL